MLLKGSLKLAILRCTFKDIQTLPAFDDTHFKDLFITRGKGGLNDYYINNSNNNINFDGSTIFPWKPIGLTLKQSQEPTRARSDIIQQCINTHGIKPSDYHTVVAIYNRHPGNAGSAHNGVLATADAPDQFSNTFLGHELGHTFGWADSYDESNRQLPDSAVGQYWDNYDIMSARNVFSYTSPRFSQAGPRVSLAYQDYSGWLNERYTLRPIPLQDSTREIRLVSPSSRLFPSGNDVYTGIVWDYFIEYRTKEGWDSAIPRNTVLIHTITPQVNAVLKNREHAAGIFWENEWLPGHHFHVRTGRLIQGNVNITILGFENTSQGSWARIKVQTWKKDFHIPQDPGRRPPIDINPLPPVIFDPIGPIIRNPVGPRPLKRRAQKRSNNEPAS